MTIQLTTVRYFTGDDPNHYTVDNRPLQDLAQNINIIKTAVETLRDNVDVLTTQGDWSSMTIEIDVNKDRAKAFTYVFSIFAHRDITNYSSPSMCIKEIVVMGYNDPAGTVTFLSNVERFTQHVTDPVTVSFGTNLDKIRITFSGYTGVNGYVSTRVERYGQ